MFMIWLIWISLKIRVLVIFIFKYLNGAEIRRWKLQTVFFLHLTGIPLNLHSGLDLSVSGSASLSNFIVEILWLVLLNSLASFLELSLFHCLYVLLSSVDDFPLHLENIEKLHSVCEHTFAIHV